METRITPELRKELEATLRVMKWALNQEPWPQDVRKSFVGETPDHLWVACCIVVSNQGRISFKGGMKKTPFPDQIVLPFDLAEIGVGIAERQLKERHHG